MDNQSPQKSQAISALVQFAEEAIFQEQIQDLPMDLQFLFELLLETEQANDQSVRLKILKSLNTARSLHQACKGLLIK